MNIKELISEGKAMLRNRQDLSDLPEYIENVILLQKLEQLDEISLSEELSPSSEKKFKRFLKRLEKF